MSDRNPRIPEPPKRTEVGRLAMREEGYFWNAYFADERTMEGAVLMGSLRMNLARIPKLKKAFLDTMTEAIAEMIEQRTGKRPRYFEEREAE